MKRSYILIGLLVILTACAYLKKHYSPWYENEDCTLLTDLTPPVTDGYIYDKLGGKNPCALENGLVFATETAVRLTSVTATEIKDYASQAREYLADGINGEKFTDFVSSQLEKILGSFVGKVVVRIGEGLRVIPKDAIISGGDVQVLDHVFAKVEEKMDEIIAMPTTTATSGVEVLLKF